MKIKISLSLIVAILTLLAFLPAGRLAVLPSPAAAQAADRSGHDRRLVVGRDEAPGSEAWLDAAQKAYTELHPNVTFTNNLLALDALLPSYEAAGQAQEGPTIMYLWGGFYTMDAVWKGWIVPISDYVGMEEAEHYINKEEAIWDGKIWSAAWYLQPSYPIVYNKDAFTAPGSTRRLRPRRGMSSSPPAMPSPHRTCRWSHSVKDTWGAGRFLLDSLAQQVTGVGEVLQAVTGETSFTDPKYVTFFERWQEMIDHDCFPDDVASLDMYTGQQLVSQGEAGLTFIAGSELASYVESIGADNTGLMKLPATGEVRSRTNWPRPHRPWP